jgi:hypothetical protein
MEVQRLNALNFVTGSNAQAAHNTSVKIKLDERIRFITGFVSALYFKPAIGQLQRLCVVL